MRITRDAMRRGDVEVQYIRAFCPCAMSLHVDPAGKEIDGRYVPLYVCLAC
jgi:hypothetical protein